MTYRDQKLRDRDPNPAAAAEAEAKVVAWAESGEPWGSRRHPEFEAGDDAREKQANSRDVMRINRAVEKFMREGLSPDDFRRLEWQANEVAKRPLDQGVLTAKIAQAVNQMVNLILTGEVTPRSAAEAVNVAEGLVRIAGTLKTDAAALAAAVSVTADTMDRREMFQRLLKEHTATLATAEVTDVDGDG